MPGPAKPKPKPRLAPTGRRRAVAPAAKPGGVRRFEIDRIVVLRVGLGILVFAFLYLILRVAIVAFGGGSANQAKRVERVVDEATSAAPGNAPAAEPPAARR
jgi:hypothetical protein